MNNLILSGLPTYLNFIFIALGACAIALIVFLLRKYIPGLKNNPENKKSDEEVANENLKSKLMTSQDEHPLDYLDEDEKLIEEDEKAKERAAKKKKEENGK